MTESVRIGLVGAGPWAKMVHAPMIASFPGVAFAGVWARRNEAAAALAEKHGTAAFSSFEALLAACDAVVFAVPPEIQEGLAIRAAEAGRALLLEKPIAGDLAGAERLAAAVEYAGVPSLVALTWRYSPAVRAFIEAANAAEPLGGRGLFVSGGLLAGSPFATPWRLERGPLLDLGPHVIDLLEAAIGPVVSIAAFGELRGWVSIELGHASGARSSASLCATAAVSPHVAGVEVFGRAGSATIDCVAAAKASDFQVMYGEFVQAVRSGLPAVVDVRHGLRIQRLLETAERQLQGVAQVR